MGRRRYQAPQLRRAKTQGGTKDRWWFRAYVDVIGESGTNRIEKAYHVGYCSEMGKREAQAEMARMVAALNQPAAILQSQVKFGVVLDKFLAMANVRPQTLSGYTSVVEAHLRPRWGNVRMCEITPLAVEEWIIEKARGLAKNTLTHIRYRFTQVWKGAQRWGFTQIACPMSLIPAVRQHGKPERRKTLPTTDQFHALLAQLRPDHREIVMLATSTGLRIGEILALRWRQMDGDYLLVEESRDQRGVIGPVKSKGSIRVVPIKHVRLAIPRGEADGFVFPCSYDSVSFAMKAAAKAIGIDYPGFGAHTFRRMHNTLFRRASSDVGLAQRQLGHADAATNDLYYIEDVADLEKRAEVAAQLMGKVMGTVN